MRTGGDGSVDRIPRQWARHRHRKPRGPSPPLLLWTWRTLTCFIWFGALRW